MTRWTLSLLALLTIGACADTAERPEEAAEAEDAAETMATEESAGSEMAEADDQETGLPDGYAMRLDRAGSDAAEYQVAERDGGLRVQTGPAGILYREDDAVEAGDYTVSATFTEVGAPADHREAFGLFVGGSDLQGEGQRYTYFLVRADGRYLIKSRDGGGTSNVSEGGWVDSDAVNAATEAGDVTNELAIEVRGDEVHFRVNGTEVETVPASGMDVHGIAGVRINHRLNVQVDDFELSTG
jgi:hypothetical protein